VIVADTNLIIYLLVAGQHSGEADAVYNKDPHWIAPLLWRSEVRNVLALYVRQRLITLDEALETVEEAEQLIAGQEFELASERVLRLAVTSGCSAYDCEFVALAQDRDLPLVTSDKALLAKFKPTAVSMSEFCS
jgi:predicted nucleic acid-binding protein